MRKEINAQTTLGDIVSSNRRIIVKINSDQDFSGSGVNALFSGWQDAGASGVDIVPLQWGSPIAASDGTSSALRWCYNEADNIGDYSQSQTTVAGRKNALSELINKSLNFYKESNHNTWFFSSLGGYILTYQRNSALSQHWTGNSADCATEFNPWANMKLSDPNRQACPMGIVLMNFAGDPAYKGDELISTIINNNRAFTPAQRKEGKSEVTDEANSYLLNGHPNAVR